MVAGRMSVDSRLFGRGEAWLGVGKDGGAHHESLCAVDLSGEGPKERIDAKGRSSGDAPMAGGDGGPIPAGKSSSESRGGVEDVRDEVVGVLAEGIDERRPEMAGAPAWASSARLGLEEKENESEREKSPRSR